MDVGRPAEDAMENDLKDGLTETVIVERKFAADGGSVYDGFLDPLTAPKFLFATPAGTMVRAEMDAQVGGKYEIVERRGGKEVLHEGEYLELVRPSKIVFTFRVPAFSAQTSTVQVDVIPIGEGCEVTLTHTGVPVEYVEGARGEWERILAAAAKVLA